MPLRNKLLPLHNNARTRTGCEPHGTIQEPKWVFLDSLPHTLNLVLTNFHLFSPCWLSERIPVQRLNIRYNCGYGSSCYSFMQLFSEVSKVMGQVY
jgi:hypothetical protein